MDPISAIGIASAVVQFVGFGLAVSQRLAEYSAITPSDVPRGLQNINVQLPLLLNSLSRIQTEEKVSKYDVDTRCMLRGVVMGSLRLVQDVDAIALKLQPVAGENLKTKLKKVLRSLKSDEKIAEIDRGLQTYIQVLILHHVVDRHEVNHAPLDEHGYFEIKDKLVESHVRREALIAQIDEAFYSVVRRLANGPVTVKLVGASGVGKTQLALGYCHEAHSSNQFRTIFWLDASSPEMLKLSLEGAAAAVQHKKDGNRKEKLAFINHFLAGRWEPWLLVLDNYRHEAFGDENALSLLPDSGDGAILLLTTSNKEDSKSQYINIPPFLNAKYEQSLREDVTYAVERGDIDAVRSAIAKGFDVNQTNTNGWPFINRAALKGFDSIVSLLLSSGASPHLDITKRCALVWAACNKNTTTVAVLLDHEDKTGSKVAESQYADAIKTAIEEGTYNNLKLIFERRPVPLDLENRELNSSLERCAKNGKIDMLQYLYTAGVVPSSAQKKADSLTAAAKSGQVDLLRMMVGDKSFPANALNEHGKAAIHSASDFPAGTDPTAEGIRNSMISYLISVGADPSLKASDNSTALHAAARRGFTSTVMLLLDAGSDPTISDRSGYTPLLSASKYMEPGMFPYLVGIKIENDEKRKKYYTSALHYSGRHGDRELLVAIIDKIDLNAVESHSGCTALMLAIKYDKTQVARYLIRKGASQTIKDNEGKMPLFQAAQRGMELVVRDLVKAKNSLGVNAVDDEGNTALIIGAGGNHEKLVAELIKMGADSELENKVGERALDVAEEKRLEKIIKLLEDL